VNLALLKASLKLHEGVRQKLYLDSKGIPTIGVGRNLRDRGLRQNEIEFMLENDCAEVAIECFKLPGWHTLSDVRQRVIAEMCFQMGLGDLLAFKKMFAALERNDFNAAADEMLDSKWAKEDSPGRAHELAQMMRTNQDLMS